MKLSCDKKSAYLITDDLTVKYLTGVDIKEGYLFVTDKSMKCYTDARYFYAAKQMLSSVGVEAGLYKGEESLSEFLAERQIENLFIDYSKVTVKDYENYKKFGVEIGDCSDKLFHARSIKSDEEIALIKKACEIAERAYLDEIVKVKEGMTENQLKSAIEKRMIELGANSSSFDIIVAFGSNGAVPHHQTGETTLKKNVPILIDMGANYKGYLSDLTRTAFFGTPSNKFIECYNAVLKANELAEEQITAGMKTDEADAIARNYLKEKGFDEYFTHSLGHGVGIEIHEYPTLSPKRKDLLEEGMIVTIEPGVYFDGEFGIRIEDTVLISGGKVKRLFTDDKNLLLIK